MQQFYRCSKHSQVQVLFICTGNQWHFQPLCTKCIADHTQKHPKNIKITLQEWRKVQDHYKKHNEAAQYALNQILGKTNELLQMSPDKYVLKKQIQSMKQQSLHQVIEFYANLQQKLLNQHKHIIMHQQSQLIKLKQDVQRQLKLLTKVQQIKTLDQWLSATKSVYFNQDLNDRMDQLNQVLKDYHQEVIQYQPIDPKMPDIAVYLSQAVKLIVKNKPNQSSSKMQIKVPTKSTIKFKEKKCKNCGGIMDYLTEWKKHLICKQCGQSERNYIKK